MKAADIIRELHLSPATCGYMRQSWNNSYGAALYFLLTPSAEAGPTSVVQVVDRSRLLPPVEL